MNTAVAVAPIVPVPRTAAGWEGKVSLFNLNDAVAAVADRIITGDVGMEPEEWLKYLDAVDDSQAIEGTQALDDIEAARILRSVAVKAGYPRIAEQKLDAVSKALKRVLKVRGLSRKDRRNMIGGQVVSAEPDAE